MLAVKQLGGERGGIQKGLVDTDVKVAIPGWRCFLLSPHLLEI